MEKCIIAIGGGELKDKTTLDIDRYIASKCKLRATALGKLRATALFLGTASCDSFPYFNSFRKTYTSVFDIKAEVALLAKQPNMDSIEQKFNIADMIYVGGGDTRFMLQTWQKTGVIDLLKAAYERGVILCGLSAGAVCWFTHAYSDWDIQISHDYSVLPALGFLNGICCPHFNERPDFNNIVKDFSLGYAIENNAAIEFVNGTPTKALGQGNAYVFENGAGKQLQKAD